MSPKFVYFAVILIVTINSVLTFSLTSVSSKSAVCSLKMGGGRNQAELAFSKKGVFKELRKKLNTAAEIPGFFDVGEGKPVSINIHIFIFSHFLSNF